MLRPIASAGEILFWEILRTSGGGVQIREGLAVSPSGTRSLLVPFFPVCHRRGQWPLPPPFGKLKNYNLYLFIIVCVCMPQYTRGNQRTIENCWELLPSSDLRAQGITLRQVARLGSKCLPLLSHLAGRRAISTPHSCRCYVLPKCIDPRNCGMNHPKPGTTITLFSLDTVLIKGFGHSYSEITD